MTYSYNPELIGEFGKDRMRFELGDTFVEEEEKTAYLSDEEISAVIENSSTWKKAKFQLVESLIRRFAYEVDEKTSPAEWSWHQRFENWKKLRDELKSSADAESISPLGNSNPSKLKRPPYFFEDMHANRNFFKGRR